MDFTGKADILFDQGNYKKAIEFYKKELEVAPESIYPKVKIGHAYSLLDDYEKSHEILANVLATDPENWYLHYVLSVNYLDEEKYSEGETHARKCLDLEPDEPYSYYLLAEVESFKNHWELALDYTKNGLELDPSNESLLGLKSRLLLKLGKKGAADAVANEILRQNPDEQSSHSLKGIVELEKKNFKAAATHFKNALSLNPLSLVDKEGLIECLKAKSVFYNFFLKRGFGKFNLDWNWSFGTVIRLLLGLKLLPIIVGLVVLYLLVCWYASVVYEVYLFLRRGYKHLLPPAKQLRAKSFLIITGVTLVTALLANLCSNSWLWLIFWLQILGVFFYTSYFEAERKIGKITSITLSSLWVLIFFLPIVLGGISNLVWSVVWGVFFLGIYGLVFSLNGVK